MSPSSETAVVLPAPLHARPAGRLVQVAARFTALVEITYGEKVASARGILALLALGATAGQTVVLRATGSDAAAAVAACAEVLQTAD